MEVVFLTYTFVDADADGGLLYTGIEHLLAGIFVLVLVLLI